MGLYTITTRSAGTVLTGAGSTSNIFNADHQNHVTHTAAPFLNSWEDTVAHMNLETNPLPNGVISLPAALSNEFERLRFVLTGLKSAISGGSIPHWYTPFSTVSFASLKPAAARMERATPFAILDNTNTNMPWDTTIYDTVGSIATPAGLVAPVDGTYIVGATMGLGDAVSTGPSGNFRLTLLRDTEAIGSENGLTSTSVPKGLNVETVAHFNANSVLAVQMFQNSGTSKTPTSNADFRPAVWMALIGR